MSYSSRSMRSATLSVLVLAGVSATLGAVDAHAGGVVVIIPKGTYLHTASADSSLDADAISLASLGIGGGDRISIQRWGDFDNGPQGDTFTTLIGVFSSNATLLPASASHRVPGALGAGVEFVSSPSFFGSEPTDIPEDFVISSAAFPSGTICIVVPQGATHLFLGPHDSLYEDNSDPDGDFGYELTHLSTCPADLDANGNVGGGDLGVMLSNWGPLTEVGGTGDLDCDGDVDGADLGVLLSAWGDC